MAPGADIQPARALADAAPTGLERVTTRYSVKQDRICLAGELPGGSPVVLWLTQRLLRRLLPPLLVWLQEQGGAAHAVMGQALYADALQGFAQQAARAQLQPQAPVQVPEGSLSCLVERVDMGRSPEAVRLVFRDAQGVVAAMVLHPQPLRQWLSILFDAWQQAEWPLEVWPDWLRESVPAKAVSAGGLVH